MMHHPLIFDIARGSFEDGPGIRTTVFFKGCPLRCIWCHNPESQSFQREIAWDQDKCTMCGSCSKACPQNAIQEHGLFRIDTKKCDACGICVSECHFDALKIIGRRSTSEKLSKIILGDREYYKTSGGGVTFSGGEPLMYPEYLEQVCMDLNRSNIHIAIQTCGFFDYEQFEKHVSRFADLIYFDLKILDREKHCRYTGRYNDLILQNLDKLTRNKRAEIIVRTPLIPKITASKKNLTDIKDYVSGLNIDGYELLDYNPSVFTKNRVIGKSVPEGLMEVPFSKRELPVEDPF